MRKAHAGKLSLMERIALQQRSAAVDDRGLVRQFYLDPQKRLPLVLTPASSDVELGSWAAVNRRYFEQALLEHGGVLLRNFKVRDVAEFENLIVSLSGETIRYSERSSPRSPVSGNIYTSTDYPADQAIFLHNENSYASKWPMKIFFYCQIAPLEGGETPIADVRKVYSRICEQTREKFERRRVMYVRNFGNLVGLKWQEVFQTDDRKQVEDHCRSAGYQFEWLEGDRLRTRRVGQSVATHPKTGEKIWFNHAAFFHISTMAPQLREGLLAQFGEEDFPNNTRYGDDTPIEPAALDEIREAYRRETIRFPWRRGDILVLDNMLVAHGRNPFRGPRKILVGMSELFDYSNIQSERFDD